MTVETKDLFAEYLAPVAAGISPVLISPDAFGKMSEVARLIPGAVAHNTFGFERRLGEGSKQADFLVLATASRGRDSLVGLAADGNAAWERVRDFALRWSTPSSSLHRVVDNVWLEFDIMGDRPETPSMFFGFRPAEHADDAGYEANVDGFLAATDEVLRLLTGRERSPVAKRTLRACFLALASSAQVFQVGVMLSRSSGAVRLCLRMRSLQHAIVYLGLVGWQGDEAGLRDVFESPAGLADDLCLDLDVGESVHPKIGLECYPGTQGRWAALLDRLVSDGLCTTDERASLLAYPGYVTEGTAGVRWPETLLRASGLLGARSTSVFVRSLHHAKIVYRPDGEPEAKAYLAVDHHWHSPNGKAEA